MLNAFYLQARLAFILQLKCFFEDDVWQTFPSPNDRFAGWAKRMGELQGKLIKLNIIGTKLLLLGRPYEFGVKATITTTLKEGLVIGMRTLPGNPYDGHSLREALGQTEILTGVRPRAAYVDREYRGHGIESTEVYISGQKRGVTRSIKQKLKRRSAIEPIIGHMKTEGRLDRCTFKGELGDAMFALLCGCGQNLRLILNHLRSTAPKFYWASFRGCFWREDPPNLMILPVWLQLDRMKQKKYASISLVQDGRTKNG